MNNLVCWMENCDMAGLNYQGHTDFYFMFYRMLNDFELEPLSPRRVFISDIGTQVRLIIL